MKTEPEELKNVDRVLSTLVNGPIELRVGNLPVQTRELSILALPNHDQKTALASDSIGMCDATAVSKIKCRT